MTDEEKVKSAVKGMENYLADTHNGPVEVGDYVRTRCGITPEVPFGVVTKATEGFSKRDAEVLWFDAITAPSGEFTVSQRDTFSVVDLVVVDSIGRRKEG